MPRNLCWHDIMKETSSANLISLDFVHFPLSITFCPQSPCAFSISKMSRIFYGFDLFCWCFNSTSYARLNYFQFVWTGVSHVSHRGCQQRPFDICKKPLALHETAIEATWSSRGWDVTPTLWYACSHACCYSKTVWWLPRG